MASTKVFSSMADHIDWFFESVTKDRSDREALRVKLAELLDRDRGSAFGNFIRFLNGEKIEQKVGSTSPIATVAPRLCRGPAAPILAHVPPPLSKEEEEKLSKAIADELSKEPAAAPGSADVALEAAEATEAESETSVEDLEFERAMREEMEKESS